MNKIALILILSMCAAFALPSYSVDIDRSGSASVTVSLESMETVSVPLPPDASNFRIVGGSYGIANSTAIVSSGQTGFASFSFSTSAFTSKEASGWRLMVLPPPGASVRIYLPPYSSITSSDPQPGLVSMENSRLVFHSAYAKTVSISYALDAIPAQQGSDSDEIIIVAAVLIAVIAIAAYLIRARQQPVQQPASQPPAQAAEKKPTLEITKGKKEMMETFNENDTKVVNHLISVNGKCRRNELERKSGISKSSLAMALNRLERRKIVEIDRTSTTHFVKLADYFLRL